MADRALGEQGGQGAVVGVDPCVVGLRPSWRDPECRVGRQRAVEERDDRVGALVVGRLAVGDALDETERAAAAALSDIPRSI
jgi:hypothetical protein